MTYLLAVKHDSFALTLHQGFARAFLIYSALMGIWGIALFLMKRNPSGGYLGALVLDEGLAVLQGVVGIVVRTQGHPPHDVLHYLYGIVAVVTLPAAYFLSDEGTSRRDSLYFGIAGLFLVGVAIRGAVTGGGS
jgi:heme A synthase